METNNQTSPAKIFVGALLVVIGGLFLLRSFNLLPVDIAHIVFSWRFFLLVIGIVVLISSNNKVLGFILTGIGAVLTLPRVFPDIDIDGKLIAGIVIIAVGIELIFRSTGYRSKSFFGKTGEKLSNDYVDDVAIFGGGEKVISSNNFKGGNITAIFGGSEIDLTSCKLAEGNNVLNITAIFGGSTIIVPKDWNVLLSVTPIFGGFSNKTRREPNLVVDESRTLIVKGVAMFGGGEIKSAY